MKREFFTVTLERMTTPNQDDVVYTDRYWSVDEKGDFLFWGSYFSPQCNRDKKVVEHLNSNKIGRSIVFLPVAYLPIDWMSGE